MSRTADVIEAYNEMLQHYAKTGKRVVQARYSNAKTRETIEKFLEWCDANDIEDPPAFVRARIYHSKEELPRSFFPKITHLRSPSIAKNGMWRDLADWVDRLRYDQRVLGQELDASSLRMVHAHRRGAWERFKRRLTHLPESCLVSEFSGGYHPKSETCCACPLQQRCAQRTNERYGFDIVTLRASCNVQSP